MAAGYSISTRALSLLLPTLISSLLIPIAAYSADFHLQTKCVKNNTQNSTNDAYANNLKNLFALLHKNTPSSKNGFFNATSGQDPNQAYGLSLCRGDVSVHDCAGCLYKAGCEIIDDCPNSREAIVWHDFCLLKYSDCDFFGNIDADNSLLLYNTQNATNPKAFNATAIGLLTDLSKMASNTAKLFASGQRNMAANDVTIYGAAQCGGDLTTGDCTNCLDWAVKSLPGITKYDNGTVDTIPVGARTLSGSCSVRYETYEFLNN